MRLELKMQLAAPLDGRPTPTTRSSRRCSGSSSRTTRRSGSTASRATRCSGSRTRPSSSSCARSRASSRSASSSKTCTSPTSRRSSSSRSCSSSPTRSRSRSCSRIATTPDLRSWELGEAARRRYRHRFRELLLEPLDAAAAAQLAAAAAGRDLSDDVAAQLAERTGGNPLFLEEAARDAVERGDGAAVPAAIQETLQARLDRLAPDVREVASVASVVGRSFGQPLLERLVPPEQLRPALSELQRLDLVVEERRRPTPEYRFRHGLVREAAYTSLLDQRRRDLHRVVGTALEELSADELSEAYGLLAHHFAEADEPERAARYLLEAGDAAKAVYADEEAHRALPARAAVPRPPRRFATRARSAVQDRARAPPRVRVRSGERGVGGRVRAPRAARPAHRSERSGSRRRWSARAPGCRATATTSSRGASARTSSAASCGWLAGSTSSPTWRSTSPCRRTGAPTHFGCATVCAGATGDRLTADDFAFTYDAMREQNVSSAHLLDGVDARVVDALTLELRLPEPRAHMLYLFAQLPFFAWPRHKVEELGPDWHLESNVVCNGPFVYGEEVDGRSVFPRNPYWPWSSSNVAELAIDRLDPASSLPAWNEGRYDFLLIPDFFVGDAGEGVSVSTATLSTSYLGFNQHAPFDDVRVRKALAHGLDRSLVTPGTTTPPAFGGFLPPAMPGHSHDLAPVHDVELARQAPRRGGVSGGPRLARVSTRLRRSRVQCGNARGSSRRSGPISGATSACGSDRSRCRSRTSGRRCRSRGRSRAGAGRAITPTRTGCSRPSSSHRRASRRTR